MNSPYTVTVSASDPAGNSASQIFNWNVAQHVTLAIPGNFTNRIADSVSVSLTASDQDGDTLTYTAANLPPGLTINATTGLVSGTVSSSASTSTPYSSSVTASDGTHSTTQAFTWTIIQHVLVVNPGTQSNKTGAVVNLPISAYDPDSDPITFAATGLPAGLSINSSTGVITGTITASTGSYTVTITATDNHSATGSQIFTWNVKTLGLLDPGKQVSHDGDTVSLQLTVQDSRSGDTLTYYSNGLPPGLSLSGTGLISGTISSTADTGSPYGVAVSVTGSQSGQPNIADFEFFTWIVNINPGSQTNTDGDPVSLPITAGDTDNDPLTFTVTGLPPGLSINASTGMISGTLTSTADLSSPYTTNVTASDGSHSKSASFTWTIVAKGVTLTPISNQTNFTGDVVSLAAAGSDPAGGVLTYSATGLPSGLTISPTTGLISGIISTTADSGSPYTVIVTASDSTNSASQTFTWTVSHVNLVSPGNQTSAEGGTVSLPVPASDADGDTLTYSASGLPSGLTINTSSGLISGMVGVTAHLKSPYLVTVMASDSSHSTSQTFSWAINHVGLTNPTNQTSLEGAVISLQLQGQDVDNDTLTFNAVGLPVGLTLNASTGLISGTIAAGDAASGTYTVDASVTDGGNIATQTFTWTVNPYVTVTTPADQTTPAGSPGSLQIQANDTGQLGLTYSATGLPPGLSINATTGLISGTVAPASSLGFSYLVTITSSDGTYSTSVDFNWGDTQANQNPVLTNPGAQSNYEGDTISLQIAAQDADGDALSYSASGLPSGLYIDNESGLISGTIGTGSVGSYTVAVTADDGQGATASQTFTWNVADPPFTLMAMPVTGVEGTPTGDVVVATIMSLNTNLTAGDFTASVSWGDGSATDQGDVEGSGGQFTVLGNHTYALAGNYTVKVSVSDADGISKTAAGTASIADAPVTFVSGVDEASRLTSTVTWLLGGIKDGNRLGLASEFAAVVDWGDGSGVTAVNGHSQQSMTISGLDGYFILSAPHAYSTGFGIYTATVTIYDGDGSQLTGTDTIRIVNAFTDITSVAADAVFQDANHLGIATDFSGTYNWGDGAVTNATFGGGTPPGTFHENGTHIYTQQGAYIVSANVTDDDGAQTSIPSSPPLYVGNPMLTAYGVNIASKQGVAFSNVEVATFTDPDWIHAAGQYSAMIDWGDGSSSSGTVTGGSGLFHVLGGHIYQLPGEFPIMVQIYSGALRGLAISLGRVAKNIIFGPIGLMNVDFRPAPIPYKVNGYVIHDDVNGNAYNPNQWQDPDMDGIIQPGFREHSWPYAYVRNTLMNVQAVFRPQPWGQGFNGQVLIKGIVGVVGAQFSSPNPISPDKAGFYTFNGLANKPLPNVATTFSPMFITWLDSTDGGNTWHLAGVSRNQIYVLFGYPTNLFKANIPLLQTIADFGSNPGGATAQAVWNNIWKHFGPPAGNPASPANPKRAKDGEPIAYYRNWNVKVDGTVFDLIRKTDGGCGQWSNFLMATILAQGLEADPFIQTLQSITVLPKVLTRKADGVNAPSVAFLVKRWGGFFQVNGVNHDPTPGSIYKYGLLHPLGDGQTSSGF